MNIRLTEAQKVKIRHSGDAYQVMQKILLRANKIERDQEHFWVMGLATNNKVLFIELVSMGSVNATIVEPTNVFRVAMLKNAVKVIFVHNHPSGELKPSENDKNITDRLIQVGKLVEIEVIEHLIITPQSFFSFTDTGLLQQLHNSLRWMPPFAIAKQMQEEQKIKKVLEQKIRKEAVQVAREKGRKAGQKDKAVEIATAMKRHGIDIKFIAEASGLSVQALAKL